MNLTSRERVLRTLDREPTDCVAVAPYMYDVSVVAAGVSLLDYYTCATSREGLVDGDERPDFQVHGLNPLPQVERFAGEKS